LTLNFELIIVSLDEDPVYTALSYVWGGDSTRPGYISVDGKHFQITHNLHAAVRHFQYEDIAPAI
jgi:hypothetical protein